MFPDIEHVSELKRVSGVNIGAMFEKVQGFIHLILEFLPCGCFMFSLRLLHFSPGTPAPAHSPPKHASWVKL